MNFDEGAAAVAKLGFTERQARFLTTVMLHTGVCVPRQYARYCRILHGQKTRKFFAKLVRQLPGRAGKFKTDLAVGPVSLFCYYPYTFCHIFYLHAQ